MIKKTLLKGNNDKVAHKGWSKHQSTQQENNNRKKSYTYTYDQNNQNHYHRFIPSHPLRQLSTNSQYIRNCSSNNKDNLTKHNLHIIQQSQERLKSQTSLNDLSAIAPIEMQCSEKKDVHQKLQFMQNFDKLYRESIVSREKENVNYIKNEYQKVFIENKDKQAKQKQQSISSIRRELKYDCEDGKEKHSKPTIGHSNAELNYQSEDFQILDIYATSLLNVAVNVSQSSIIETKQDAQQQSTQKQKKKSYEITAQYKNQRKCGGIRRNSLTTTASINANNKQQLYQNNTFRQTHKNNPSYQQKNHAFATNINSIMEISQNKKKKSIDITKQVYITTDEDTPIIDSSIQQLFYSISINKMTISQQQMEVFPFTCEMRLILGPILTKFRQKKYYSLNIESFMKEFLLILEDFSEIERRQICQKIKSRKYYQFDEVQLCGGQQYGHKQNKRQQYENEKSQYHIPLKQLQQQFQTRKSFKQSSYNHYQTNQRHNNNINCNNKSIAQDRLTLLASKVDTCLSRINQQYNNTNGNNNYYEVPSKKQKLSTLMSRLSEIEEISGDSEDLMSKSDSYRIDNIDSYRDSNTANICPNKNVYVNDTLFFQDDQDINKNYQLRQRETVQKVNKTIDDVVLRVQHDKNDRRGQQYQFERYNSFNAERQIETRGVGKRLQSISLTQSRQKPWISRESSLCNSRAIMKSQSRKDQVYSNPYAKDINDQNSETLHNSSSLRSSINLSFRELQKYLS